MGRFFSIPDGIAQVGIELFVRVRTARAAKVFHSCAETCHDVLARPQQSRKGLRIGQDAICNSFPDVIAGHHCTLKQLFRAEAGLVRAVRLGQTQQLHIRAESQQPTNAPVPAIRTQLLIHIQYQISRTFCGQLDPLFRAGGGQLLAGIKLRLFRQCSLGLTQAQAALARHQPVDHFVRMVFQQFPYQLAFSGSSRLDDCCPTVFGKLFHNSLIYAGIILIQILCHNFRSPFVGNQMRQIPQISALHERFSS